MALPGSFMSVPSKSSSPATRGRYLFLGLLAALMVPALACGTFSTRFPVDSAMPEVVITPTVALPTSTPIVIPTPSLQVVAEENQGLGGALNANTMSRVSRSDIDLEINQRARIIVAAGINMREAASLDSPVVQRLSTGVLVQVLDGPFQNDDLYWWQVEALNGQGQGLVAEGLPNEPWLEAAPDALVPVNRDPVVGDTVRVSIARLNLRSTARLNAARVAVIEEGREFTVVDGPQEGDGYTWFRIRLPDGSLIGWAVARIQDNQRALTPLE